jgi:hypothetical protein
MQRAFLMKASGAKTASKWPGNAGKSNRFESLFG